MSILFARQKLDFKACWCWYNEQVIKMDYRYTQAWCLFWRFTSCEFAQGIRTWKK